MFPILYESITSGTVPADRGLGTLSDCVSCVIEQERNGIYELTMEYPKNGIHAADIGYRRIIKAKPNFTDNPQLFRIDRIGKTMNGIFTVYGKHISYDLSGFAIAEGTAINAAQACSILQAAATGYSITTDKTVTAEFKIDAPASVKSFFAGKQGSFLDIYGPADIKYDNFNVQFLAHAGEDRGVTIRYGKNLLQLSQEMDSSNLYTHVLCYYKPQEGTTISGDEVATGLTLDTKKVLIVDSSTEFNEPPTPEDLTARATKYINDNNLTVPSNNITLDFIQSGELNNRVDLCDTVNIYYEALGITRAEVKCIRTKWDCLREKYIETEFGDAKQTLAGTISNNTASAEAATNAASNAGKEAGEKRRVFLGAPEPPYDLGDLYVNGENIYYCSNPRAAGEEYHEDDWTLASDYVGKTKMEEAISSASELITGTTGGNIVMHLNNAGQPYEFLILDKDDQTTPTTIDNAERVWRWNAGGLAHSSNGYNGPYADAAITRDGKINASAITVGNLDASKVTIQHLTAAMFEGSKITLGGLNNQAGVFELKNEAGLKIGEMTSEGLIFYGSGPEGQRSYVKLNNEVGFAGYDKNGNKLFWVNLDEFRMKKCVAEEEINACGMIKFVPVTIRDGQGNITNEGIAEVAIV